MSGDSAGGQLAASVGHDVPGLHFEVCMLNKLSIPSLFSKLFDNTQNTLS